MRQLHLDIAVDIYNAEIKALDAHSNLDRERLEAEKQRLGQPISRSVELLLKGTITESVAEKVLPKYRQRIAELAQELSFPKAPFKVANLLEAAVDRYRVNLDRLATLSRLT